MSALMAAPNIITRSETPPHHPNYQIHLPTSHIEKLIELSLPGAQLVSVAQLPSGRSYNNRIYYLCVRGSSVHLKESSDAQEQHLVLKINGRFFGADKVQNEVACLRLLGTYSPDVPVPQVLAWSEDGKSITSLSGNTSMPHGLRTTSTGKVNESGWVLMTRVPGEPISSVQPSSDDMYRLLEQLAEHVATWRRLIPSQVFAGNLRFCDNEYEHSRPDIEFRNSDLKGSRLVIRGLLGEGLKRIDSIATLSDYYRIKIADKMGQLEEKPVYEPNRTVLPLLKSFVTEKLPHLNLLPQDTEKSGATETFVFTHYDLSPRNILVSGQPPRITGIVDFEFAGFFSPIEEFLNDHVNNNGDWPDELYQSYLEKLEQNGVATPARGVDKAQWKQALYLEELLQHIAPWWLPGKYEGIGLDAELRKSEVIVRETLQKFSTAF